MEVFLIIGALVALVGAAVLLRHGDLLGACLVTLVAGIVFGPFFFSVPGGPVPLTIDRALWAGLVGLYLVYRYCGWTTRRAMTTADVVMLALIGALTLNTFLFDWKLNNSQPLSYLVFFWYMPLAVYWIARQMRITTGGLRAIYLTFAAMGVYLAITAVFEARWQFDWVYPRFIGSLSHKEFLGRARGPLLNPAGNGVLLVLCLACGLTLWPRLGKLGRVALVCGFLPLIMLGDYYTLTRSAWMGAAAATLLLAAVCLPRHLRMPALACTMIFGTIGVAANWDRLLSFQRDKDLSAAEVADSASLRPILAYVAWNMFWDRPILGCGLAHYQPECYPYLHDRSTELPVNKVRPYVQHNAYLSLLVETGLLGAGAFTLLNVLWLQAAWRLWQRKSATLEARQFGLVFGMFFAGYLPNAMFHDTTIIPQLNMLMFFVAGVMVNLGQQRVQGSVVRVQQTESTDREAIALPS